MIIIRYDKFPDGSAVAFKWPEGNEGLIIVEIAIIIAVALYPVTGLANVFKLKINVYIENTIGCTGVGLSDYILDGAILGNDWVEGYDAVKNNL